MFDNVQKSYKEFRKRCDFYHQQMEIAGRQGERIFNIVTLLSGNACDLVEDLSMEVLQSESCFDGVPKTGYWHPVRPLDLAPRGFRELLKSYVFRPPSGVCHSP